MEDKIPKGREAFLTFFFFIVHLLSSVMLSTEWTINIILHITWVGLKKFFSVCFSARRDFCLSPDGVAYSSIVIPFPSSAETECTLNTLNTKTWHL